MVNKCEECGITTNSLMHVEEKTGKRTVLCPSCFTAYHRNKFTRLTKDLQKALSKERRNTKIQTTALVVVNLVVLVWNLCGIVSGRFNFWFFNLLILVVSVFQLFALYRLVASAIDFLQSTKDSPYVEMLVELESEWEEVDRQLARFSELEKLDK